MADTYSTFNIGNITTFVDPEQLSVSIKAHMNVVPSIFGNKAMSFFQNNDSNTYPLMEVSVSGVFEQADVVSKLRKILIDRKLVSIGGPGISADDLFIMTSFRSEPIKQGVCIPGIDTEYETVKIKFTYSATFTRISANPENNGG